MKPLDAGLDAALHAPALHAADESAPSALLDSIVEATPQPTHPAPRLALPSGRAVEARADGAGERVTVRSATGEVELEVSFTERGPVLRFRAADLELASAGDVRIDCDRFLVRAASGIVQETGGDLQLTGRSARIEAERGDVEIEANDDVKLLGERIKLNS